MIGDMVDSLYSEDPEGTLYHYTSLGAFKSIVDHKALWATEIHYLNDSSELVGMYEMMRVYIMEMKNGDVENSDIYDQFDAWLKDRLNHGHLMFVACFTHNGSLLSQWRSYCPIGRGVSFGFEASELLNHFREKGYKFGKCIYDLSKKADLILSLLFTAVQHAKGVGKDKLRHENNSYHTSFEMIEDEILFIASLLKHKGFSEEQEWRLVVGPVKKYIDEDIYYREGSSMLVPYLQVSLPVNNTGGISLKKVFLGPTPNQNISMRSLHMFLSKSGCNKFDISYCQIPYRAW